MRSSIKITVMAGILMIGGLSMTAQKSFLMQDIQPQMALTSETLYNVELSAESSADRYRFYMEEKLQLKDWMLEQTEWENSETEQEIAVEDWMLELSTPEITNLSELVKEDRETPLALQKWMYCCQDWGMPSL